MWPVPPAPGLSGKRASEWLERATPDHPRTGNLKKFAKIRNVSQAILVS